MENKIERIKYLVQQLNEARKEYYQNSNEIINNKKYDKLFDELQELEGKTDFILNNSPTQNVGYDVLKALTKITHAEPMLSLDKTKEILQLKKFIGNRKGVLSWKLDGLTVVMVYNNGVLQQAITRGNGIQGTDITHIAKHIVNLPNKINYKGKLIVRGECLIKYSDFNRININGKYQNPRNLASGTLMSLDSKVAKERSLNWFAFNLVEIENIDFNNSFENQFKWLESQGFKVVDYTVVDKANIEDTVLQFKENIKNNDFPSDGLVVVFNDIKYGLSLGNTGHHPLNGLAFKWQDSTEETILRDIQFQVGRTSVLTPVALFDTVTLEGTEVSRASLHNISILKQLELGIGDTITVYKANMIIPQIDENLTRSNSYIIPDTCPICGEKAVIKQTENAEFLMCTNPDCTAKRISQFSHFVSRNAMNIMGLSEAILEKLINKGFLHSLDNIYKLEQYKKEIINMSGFGSQSYKKLIDGINNSKQSKLSNFLFALGIPNIGQNSAKLLVNHFNILDDIQNATISDLMQIDDFGDISSNSVHQWFRNEDNKQLINRLLKYITFEEDKKVEVNNDDNLKDLTGQTFVITGSVNTFKNRDEFKALVESLNGKVTGSVSKSTDFLVNSDIESTTGKNKKAKDLNIPIITEVEFNEMINRII